jgi:hypothetical protein
MNVSIVISAVVLLVLLLAVRARRKQLIDPQSAVQAIVPIDLEAFRNLIDKRQDQFLRKNLTGRDFRRVQRARYLAVTEYLWHVASNAGVILRLGEAARAAHEASVEKQGAELASAALSVRLYCMLALAQAYSGFLFPGVAVSVGTVADAYDHLTSRLWVIGRSWKPLANVS